MDTTEKSVVSDWEEIMGKDLTMRRVVHGSGNIAEMGTTITCNMKGYLVNSGETQKDPFEEWTNQKFKIGESDAVPGVEMALRFSRVGDLLRVRCQSRFCYGPAGRPPVIVSGNTDQHDKSDPSVIIPAIPANADLEYELDVTAHLAEGRIDPELLTHAEATQQLETSEDGSPTLVLSKELAERLLALTELQQRKEAGNRWFSYSDFARAARAYSKATQVADRYFNGNANASNANARALEGLDMKDGEASVGAAEAALAQAEKEKELQRRVFAAGDEEVVAVYISCLNNMAACQLRLGENAKAKDICIRVLEIDPANHKALLRAAKAALATHNYEECDLCLQRLLAVATPGSSAALAATAERRRLKQAQLEYKQRNKQMSNNMAKQLFPNAAAGGGGGTSNSNKGNHKKRSEPSNEDANIDGNNYADGSNSSTSVSSSGKEGNSHPSAKEESPTVATTNAPTVNTTATTTTAAPTTGPAAAADRGLLLLLVTSLAVLLVSVVMVVWTAGKKGAAGDASQ